jgi:hypothetical protein
LKNGAVTLTAGILKVLPVPRADVSVRKIWKFKQHRTGYLLHFRQMLDDFETKLTACKSEAEIKHLAEVFRTKLKDSLTQLEEVLKDAKIPTFLGSMESLLKVNSPTWLPTALGGLRHMPSVAAVPLSWTIAGTVFAGSIVVGKYLWDKRNERRKVMRENQASYFFEAKRKRIISWPDA